MAPDKFEKSMLGRSTSHSEYSWQLVPGITSLVLCTWVSLLHGSLVCLLYVDVVDVADDQQRFAGAMKWIALRRYAQSKLL